MYGEFWEISLAVLPKTTGHNRCVHKFSSQWNFVSKIKNKKKSLEDWICLQNSRSCKLHSLINKKFLFLRSDVDVFRCSHNNRDQKFESYLLIGRKRKNSIKCCGSKPVPRCCEANGKTEALKSWVSLLMKVLIP